MVGLLIVSHSANIAEGVKQLAQQMAGQQVPIVAAGGAGDGSLGTSVDLIRAGADELTARGSDGLLVLVDLGSAVMSAEMALEGSATPFLLSSGPLVEGALLAAVEAAIGADLQQVAAVAEQARDLRKLQQ